MVAQQARASLRQLDRWIADEERREAERRQAEERRPPPPEWLIERGLDRRRDAIRQQVPACSKCRPDTRVGLLE
nr:hypothetical protein [Streptomyces sp. NRRL F-5650]